MSLDKLKITPWLIRELYAECLIDSNTEPLISGKSVTDKKKKSSKPSGIKFLGNNTKHIAVILNSPDHIFTEETDLNFLIAILKACNITMDDVALINTASQNISPQELNDQLSPEILLFFGIGPQDAGYPLQIPDYRLQEYNKQNFLAAPSLVKLASDKEEKKQLWMALKSLFSV